MKLKLGTRTSKLALWQTNHVIKMLQAVWPALVCEIVPYVTKGDKTQALGKPLPEIGGKGLFTLELEEGLRSGKIDLAVHSLKDLPVENPEGLLLGAIPTRGDVGDVLVAREGQTVASLPLGARVGTSSLRRQAQLRAARPDLEVASIRGNVDTRIRKVMDGDYDAAVLAAAGLIRLEISDQISQYLPFDMMLPAPGQGALAVQCRGEDEDTLRWLAAIDSATTRATTTAERAFLHALGGGCATPVGALATMDGEGVISLQGRVSSLNGRSEVDVTLKGTDPQKLGEAAAQKAVARGANRILEGK